jgi:hypothetical protein
VAGDLILNHAHVEVHVKDAYGNDLPDYEVVYLLENIDGWLGGSQGASHTYIPFAYLRDYNVNNDTLDSLGTQYDSNGAAPDSDEPTPASDPYAYMVGDGGTDAFFFNQWLGSEKPVYEGHAGLPTWYAKVSGMQFLGYVGDKDHVTYTYTWQRWPGYTDPDLYLNGFDGILEDGGSDEAATAPQDIYLATDGAKAWTRDGYFIPEDGTEVIPNLLTGSNVDIQLADNVTGYDLPDNTNHAESILRVMVYAPADGLVQEGDYIWSTQVHQSWEAPVATTITLAPATDYAVTGLETETLVATVKDQFGTIMPGVEVTFASVNEDTDGIGYVQGGPLEGTLHETADDLTATTDENGNAAITWGATNVVGDWGVEKVYAYIDANGNSTLDFNDINGDGNWDNAIENATEVVSNAALIQWAYDDVNDNYVSANNGEQKVTVFADILNTQGWNGDTFRVYENPGGNVAGSLGSATYACAVDNEISTNLKQWYTGESFWVNDASSTNDDGVINWIYSVVN